MRSVPLCHALHMGAFGPQNMTLLLNEAGTGAGKVDLEGNQRRKSADEYS